MSHFTLTERLGNVCQYLADGFTADDAALATINEAITKLQRYEELQSMIEHGARYDDLYFYVRSHDQ